MKITLSMIHERLVFQGYPVSALHGGDQTVKSIHLLPSADTNDAYIRKTDNGVSLTCGQGSFEVRGIPLEAVYDAAQEALRFYTEWELSLIHAVWRGASVQEIIDLAEPVFQNPIFVCTWQGKLLGYTQKYENDNIREFWSILVKEKQVPIFCLKNLRESRFYDVVAMENSSQLLSFSDYGHRCIMGMIHRDHEICCTIKSSNTTPGLRTQWCSCPKHFFSFCKRRLLLKEMRPCIQQVKYCAHYSIAK